MLKQRNSNHPNIEYNLAKYNKTTTTTKFMLSLFTETWQYCPKVFQKYLRIISPWFPKAWTGIKAMTTFSSLLLRLGKLVYCR